MSKRNIAVLSILVLCSLLFSMVLPLYASSGEVAKVEMASMQVPDGTCYFDLDPSDSTNYSVRFYYNGVQLTVDRIRRFPWLSQDHWASSGSTVGLTTMANGTLKPGNGEKFAQYEAQHNYAVNGPPAWGALCGWTGMNP